MDKMLKVLNISSGDLIGSRFNGYDWLDAFEKIGVSSKMKVHWNYQSKDERVSTINPFFPTDSILRKFARAEYILRQEGGRENQVYSWAQHLFQSKEFIEADLIHLQIVQDGTLDVKTIKSIFDRKPTLWTWHDPWPITGHCIYPMDCGRFHQGCGECPDLDRGFAVKNDHTKENRLLKETSFKSGYTLHVASKWFAQLIESTGKSKFPDCHILPFGIDMQLFQPAENQYARKILGIPENAFVLGVRAVTEPQKNFKLLQNALERIPKDVHVYVLTIQEKGLLKDLSSNISVIELGWTNSITELQQFYSVLDLFVMPSLFETFGLMALEAAASGVPVIGVKDTAVSEVLDLNHCGYSISGKSSQELADVIMEANKDKEGLQNKSLEARRYTLENYDLNSFLRELKKLYESTISEYSNA
jgi:glycosyltransferase involved in cell wall biosynthesis